MNKTSFHLGLPDASTLPALLKELEDPGAQRRSASEGLKFAMTEIKRQIEEPDLFGNVAVESAAVALAANAPRYEAEKKQEFKRDLARSARERIRRERRTVSWASCCMYLYSRNAHEHTYWMNCHRCRKPLVYADDIPATVRE